MYLYHATTEKLARMYRKTGYIRQPVRGFDTEKAAMAWAMRTGRTVIYRFLATNPHKLPDHHNKYGTAYWNDDHVTDYVCTYSAANPHRRKGV